MSALFIATAIGAGFLLGLRVGLALGRRNALKHLAKRNDRGPQAEGAKNSAHPRVTR